LDLWEVFHQFWLKRMFYGLPTISKSSRIED
jgi:hypothetical protein